tara:strand:- start:382 stop:561 length:180 start_codon:yes stop_codon:yes gene_type:complete
MNDILKDIEKLKEIQAICEYFSRETIVSHLEDMIKEKQKIVKDFEKKEFLEKHFEKELY